MSNIKITADSTCDLPLELVQKLDVAIKPLYTVLGDKSLLDSVEVTPDDIYEFVDKTGQLPKTSAGSVADYISLFEQFVKEGMEVVHFSLGSGLSSSYQNACIAASEVGNVYVVDTESLSSGSGLVVYNAYELVQGGMSAADVADASREYAKRIDASFVVDNLDYLHKGGRCSSVAMLGANLLKIKPVIGVAELGKMSMVEKPRGQFDKVLKKYVDARLSQDGINKKRIFITHTKCDSELVDDIVAQVKAYGFEEVIETTAGCVITSHCGPGTLGVLFEKQN